MARFKIDVEIDWLCEDRTLDEEIKESIKDHIIDKIEENVLEDIRKTAVQETENRIGLWINNYISKLITDRKIEYKENQWDDETEIITIEELIGRKFEESLRQTVDEKGNPTNSSYDRYGTQLDWLTGKLAKKYTDERVKEFVKDIKSDIKSYTSEKVKNEIMKQLTASLVSNIDFNKVFNED